MLESSDRGEAILLRGSQEMKSKSRQTCYKIDKKRQKQEGKRGVIGLQHESSPATPTGEFQCAQRFSFFKRSQLLGQPLHICGCEWDWVLKQQLFILLSNIWFEYKEGEAVAGYVSFSPALCAVINSLTIAMTGKLFKSIRIFLWVPRTHSFITLIIRRKLRNPRSH